MGEAKNTPLFVDLDGTYTKADLLFESFTMTFKKNPLVIFYCILWLLKGKEKLKYELSELANIDTNILPLNPEFQSFLMNEKSRGRLIYLATGSNEKYAKDIFHNTNIFNGYICSCKKINLTGENKLKKIKEISNRFSYAGNDSVDLAIFKQAEQRFLVNASAKTARKTHTIKIDKVFDVKNFDIYCWIAQLRIHQWLKNLLIFVPLIVSGELTYSNNIFTMVYAFIAFSFLASSTYILNDLLDLESDRSHATKKNRPLASGMISIKETALAGLILLIFATCISFSVGYQFSLTLLIYLCLTLLYSFRVKRFLGMDVIFLALLYTIRILAGGAAIGVIVSFWLLTFSVFVFLSLALLKRCAEIQLLKTEGKLQVKGRGYVTEDYSTLKSFGTSSAMLAVLVFCFYINNNMITNQYQQPDVLWLIIPALCYWLMRVWLKTHRGEMHDDPIIFSLSDKASLAAVAFCGLIIIMAQIL